MKWDCPLDRWVTVLGDLHVCFIPPPFLHMLFPSLPPCTHVRCLPNPNIATLPNSNRPSAGLPSSSSAH